jgi:hypothetical protein
MFFLFILAKELILSGQNTLQEQTIAEVKSDGMLTINQCKIKSLKHQGMLTTDHCEINKLHSQGMANLNHDKIDSLIHEGDLSASNSKLKKVYTAGFTHFENCTIQSATYKGTRIEIKNSHIDTVTIEKDNEHFIDVFVYHGSRVKKLIMKGKNIRVICDSRSKIDTRKLS